MKHLKHATTTKIRVMGIPAVSLLRNHLRPCSGVENFGAAVQGLELPVPKATQRAAAEAKAKFEASPAGKAAAAAAAAAAGVVTR